MTQICYTLEEAADKLKLTETVLVRLSQYFKMPRAAYEESGYLSFKGDLAFSEQDINFFRQAKERLLLGESLDEVKSRIREQSPPIQGAASSPSAGNRGFEAHMAEATGHGAFSGMTSQASMTQMGLPIREIQDRQPYEKAAEQSFERYKNTHRTGLGRVFENMLKEVGGTQQAEKKKESIPVYRPMKGLKARESGQRAGQESQLPFSQHYAEPVETTNYRPESRPMAKNAKATGEPSWEQMLKQATQQPRTMNSHLKGAAALLRERAIGMATKSSSRFPS